MTIPKLLANSVLLASINYYKILEAMTSTMKGYDKYNEEAEADCGKRREGGLGRCS